MNKPTEAVRSKSRLDFAFIIIIAMMALGFAYKIAGYLLFVFGHKLGL